MASNANEAKLYLHVLDQKLKARNPEIQLYENYYEGVHRLQFATTRFRSTFGNLFQAFADNFCELIVSTASNRLIIDGFRTGTGSNEADTDAAQIWTDNVLDSDYSIAHTDAIKLGLSYVLIDQENKAFDTESPLITIKHPAHAIVHNNPANPRERLAGLHEWTDELTGQVCATLYLPDCIYRFELDDSEPEKETQSGMAFTGLEYPTDYLSSPAPSGVKWIPRKGVPFEVPNTLGVVPLIPLRNNPTLKIQGRSDIAIAVPVQDAINKLCADMLIASEFAAYPQRWATGLEIPKDPQTGKPLNTEQFLSSVGRVWTTPDEHSKFGQFEASNLKNYVGEIEMWVQHLAAITSTPQRTFLDNSGNPPSGDSVTASESGLIAKCRQKQTNFNPTWTEVLKLAFKIQGDDRAGEKIQTIWGDVEQRIYSQKVDGALKLSVLGAPQDAVWEETGKSPEEVARWHVLKEGMGQTKNSPEFAEATPAMEAEKPPKVGPDGNLVVEQAISTAERVGRIND